MSEQSGSIKELAAALVSFHKEVGKISRDANNPFFKRKYASLENILDAIADPLSKSGLSIVQLPFGEGWLETILVHESGEYLGRSVQMEVKEKNNPQAMGSAITYYRRYAISALLCLNVGEDDDGNSAAPQRTAPRPAREEEPPPWETEPSTHRPAVQVRPVTTPDDMYSEDWVEVGVASVFKGTSKTTGKPYTMVKTTDDQTYFYGRDFTGTLIGGGMYRLHLEGKNITSAEEI